MKPRITFVSHQASRTGAPIALLHMLQHMNLSEYETEHILLEGGPLLSDFSDICPTVSYSTSGFVHSALKYSKKLLPKALGWQSARNYCRQVNTVPDVFYLHSHVFDFLQTAKALHVPTIFHVHEDEISFAQVSTHVQKIFATYPEHYIVNASHVQDILLSMDIDPTRISVVPPGIPCDTWKRETDGVSLREEIGIPKDAIVIGGSGEIHPRKGVDLWLQCAYAMQLLLPKQEVHFVWVGAESPSERIYSQLMRQDVKRLHMNDRVHFVGGKKQPKPYFEMFDFFILSSRQEPFGLVSIENLLLGTPVAAFDSAGGPREMQHLDGMHVIPGLDAHAMAEYIAEWVQKNSQSLKMQINTDVIHRDYDIHRTVPQIEEVLQTIVKANSCGFRVNAG